ncbi:MAG: hypothetical protein ABSF65_07845 [Candidatus Bathyarchaeia archaeon]|jgi:hypothetical protein
MTKTIDFWVQQKVTYGIVKEIQLELKETVFYSNKEWWEIRQELINTLATIKKYKAEKKGKE